MLTLNEKVRLLTGEGGFGTCSIPSRNIKGIRMADGPNGVKTEDGRNLCIMNSGLMASSWDKELCYEVGRVLGIEAVESGVDMILAPAINLKRNPLAGRNFEYYSEDPVLTGTLAAEYIKGIKSMGVLVCAKHFACNNQEYRRWTQNSVVDDDTLRNLYLKAFEIVVKQTDVDAIMASYNQVNGVAVCENRYLLTDILRKEWQYKGVLMSDWCAMNHCVESFQNGLDLEMPGNAHNTVPKLLEAVENGKLSEEDVNRKVERILALSEEAAEKKNVCAATIDVEKLIQMTGESFVLLKNDGILPFEKTDKVLLIGTANHPRIQGGGCAEMKTNTVKTPYEEIAKKATVCDCVDGYDIKGKERILAKYDKIVVFLTLPEDCDSEAFDRKTLCFPEEQIAVLRKIRQYNVNLLVVLQNGSAVDLSFENEVKGILETYYAGSYGACALAEVLYGNMNPSGKLAESFPLSDADVPNRSFFGQPTDVCYIEKEFIGYRYYTTYGIKPRYPFGFGLSYCQFEIEHVTFEQNGAYNFTIGCEVTNTSGRFSGKETIQIYLKSQNPFEPRMQLLEFASVRLQAGETKHCTILLNREHFERYVSGQKLMRTGSYTLCVATSSEQIIAEKEVALAEETKLEFNENTLVGSLLSEEKYRDITLTYMKRIINFWAYGMFETDRNFEENVFLKNSIYNMPLRAFSYFAPEEFDDKSIECFLTELKKIS